jgi:hypothetical protein
VTIPNGTFTLYFHVFSAPKPFPSRLTCWVMTLVLADHFLFFLLRQFLVVLQFSWLPDYLCVCVVAVQKAPP